MDLESISVREAAVLSGASERAVRTLIEEDELPRQTIRRTGGRMNLHPAVCSMIRVHHAVRRDLTPGARKRAYRYILETAWDDTDLRAGATFEDGPLRLDLAAFVLDGRAAVDRYRAALDHIVTDPDVRGGLPTLRGTRLGVHEVAELVEAAGLEEALAAHPSLTCELAEAAETYARGRPRRGRPRSEPRGPIEATAA